MMRGYWHRGYSASTCEVEQGKGEGFERFSMDLKREELLKNADLGAWTVSHVDTLPFIAFIFCL